MNGFLFVLLCGEFILGVDAGITNPALYSSSGVNLASYRFGLSAAKTFGNTGLLLSGAYALGSYLHRENEYSYYQKGTWQGLMADAAFVGLARFGEEILLYGGMGPSYTRFSGWWKIGDYEERFADNGLGINMFFGITLAFQNNMGLSFFLRKKGICVNWSGRAFVSPLEMGMGLNLFLGR
ncbi:MAG: hypothetical protein ABIM88_09265 [candidate division WOR-3 bacterium]